MDLMKYLYLNKAEELNSEQDVSLSAFLSRALQKCIEFEISTTTTNLNYTRINTSHRISNKIDELLPSRDTTHQEAELLQMKVTKLEDSKDDKLMLDRYSIKYGLELIFWISKFQKIPITNFRES